MLRSNALKAAFALLVLSASACRNPSQPGYTDPSVKVVSVQAVKLTPQSIQLSAIGETKQLVATLSPANATDQAIIWESTNPTVASVDAAGLVTAKAAGSGVFITAYSHDGLHQASVNVTVNP